MKIQFLNHACIKIQLPNCTILTDPWFEGSAFNDGWDLIVQTANYEKHLEDVDYIWVSHEHPDHFSPKFFLSLPQQHKERITILFQETKDKRVLNFLSQKGFKVKEVEHSKIIKLTNDVEFAIGPSDFYDSWLFVRSNGQSCLNLNDCPVSNTKELSRIRQLVGSPTVLLTQFSYAAWKGGRDAIEFRKTAARRKLESVRQQAHVMGATYLVPIASFIYFSNKENFYLNDAINTPLDVCNFMEQSKVRVIILKPEQWFKVGSDHNNSVALSFWEEQIGSIHSRVLRGPGVSYEIEDLKLAFEKYKTRLRKNNSWLFILLARYNPILRGFEPLNIFLWDLDKMVRISIVDGFVSVGKDNEIDVSMHSNSLKFIFDFDFGYDTLTVNGRFEATQSGFKKMTKSFALGSLNSMGFNLGPKLLFRSDLIINLLRRLSNVSAQLSKAKEARRNALEV